MNEIKNLPWRSLTLQRDALSHAQTSLLEKDNELVVLRQRLSVFETTKTTNPEVRIVRQNYRPCDLIEKINIPISQ